jgi:predicted DNA-binding transcriptional regulator YafY
MNSTERRMKLILLLQQSTRRLTVENIADKFNISRRTVFRDFNALSELNVPVTWDGYNGYGIIRDYTIPPLMFTSKELATIIIGLNFVKSQVDKTLIEDAEGVELKMKEVLSDELQDFMESLDERTVVDPYLHYGPEKMKGGDWYLINTAIFQSNCIQFQYQYKPAEGDAKRKIDPYLLVFYRDHWNVIGFSHKREAIRNFILDRMDDITILAENFVPYGDINPEALIFRSEGKSYQIEVKIQSKALRRFEANLPAKIIKKEYFNPSLVKISFLFDNLDFINNWLLQFPKEIEIVSPLELIGKRKTLLKEMINQY